MDGPWMELYGRIGKLEDLTDKFAELGVQDLAEFEQYCLRRLHGFHAGEPADKDGLGIFRLAHIWRYIYFFPGFGLEGLNFYAGARLREQLEAEINRALGPVRVLATGALRRCEPMIHRLELLLVTDEPGKAVLGLTGLPSIKAAKEFFNNGVTCETRFGVDAVFHLCAPGREAAALQWTTGPERHNEALDFHIRAGGHFRDEVGLLGDLGPSPDPDPDRSVYEFLGLPWIPPEARTDGGGIRLALLGELEILGPDFGPRGDTHSHTNAGDGYSSLEQMAARAAALGHRFLVVSDHSQSHTIANGLPAARLREQVARIRELNARHGPLRLLAGIEAEILADGTIDCPLDKGGPEGLDWVNAGLHHRYDHDSAAVTARIIKAMSDPRVDAVVHPRGTYTTRKASYEADMPAVIDAAAEYGVAVEFNCFPDKLDLDAELLLRCRQKGVKLVMGSDAHGAEQLEFIFNGVRLLRRLGARPDDFLAVEAKIPNP